jgi:DNA-directed RNA polymerase specialized sigma24 family protein
MSTLNTLKFETREEALKFSNEWGAWLQHLTHNEFCNYIRKNKDKKYHCLVVPKHNQLADLCRKSETHLQLFNDVALEMFLLTSPK